MSGLGGAIDRFVGPFDAKGWSKRGNLGFLKLIDVACCIGVPVSHRLWGKQSLTWDDLENERIKLVCEGHGETISGKGVCWSKAIRFP